MRAQSILLILAILIMGCHPKSEDISAPNIEVLREQLDKEIQSSGAEVGLAFKDLETGESLFINAKEMMHAASTMKVPVMIEVFKQAEMGKFSLEDGLLIKNEFYSFADGSPFSLEVADDSDDEIYRFIGQKMSIKELVFRMITVSSNLATNLLVEWVDAKNVMATLNALGIHHMHVLRGVEDGKAYRKGLNNITDAYDLMLVMEAITTRKAGSEEACGKMIEILSEQKYRNKIPAGLPQSIKVANKTGSISIIDHDAAIVFPEYRKPYVLVVLTRGVSDHKKAEQLIAKLSQLVYQYASGVRSGKD